MTNREYIEKKLHEMSDMEFYEHLAKKGNDVYLCFYKDCSTCKGVRVHPHDCIDKNINWLSKNKTTKSKEDIDRWCGL